MLERRACLQIFHSLFWHCLIQLMCDGTKLWKYRTWCHYDLWHTLWIQSKCSRCAGHWLPVNLMNILASACTSELLLWLFATYCGCVKIVDTHEWTYLHCWVYVHHEVVAWCCCVTGMLAMGGSDYCDLTWSAVASVLTVYPALYGSRPLVTPY